MPDVTGHLVFDTGVPAAGVTVRAYSKQLRGEPVLLGEVRSGRDGRYTIEYADRPVAAVELRVVTGRGEEIVVSEPKFRMPRRATLNLVVPQGAHPIAPEFQRVVEDLTEHVDGLAQLATISENADRQDLTLLAAASSWDARIVAVAASAARAARETGLEPEALYAMFRAGLPTDVDQLAMTGAYAVQRALQAASDGDIVNLNADQMKAAIAVYQRFAASRLQAARPAGALSTYGELLETAPMTPAEKDLFAELYFSSPEGGRDFWNVAASRLPEPKIKALQLQGNCRC